MKTKVENVQVVCKLNAGWLQVENFFMTWTILKKRKTLLCKSSSLKSGQLQLELGNNLLLFLGKKHLYRCCWIAEHHAWNFNNKIKVPVKSHITNLAFSFFSWPSVVPWEHCHPLIMTTRSPPLAAVMASSISRRTAELNLYCLDKTISTLTKWTLFKVSMHWIPAMMSTAFIQCTISPEDSDMAIPDATINVRMRGFNEAADPKKLEKKTQQWPWLMLTAKLTGINQW